jgi:uncharacterized metal-binding protein YceD (DUF177 family)
MTERPRESRPGAEPWSVPAVISEIPETGRTFDLVADATSRTAIAQAADVLAVNRLEATFDVVRQGRDGLRVTGRVSADIEQACVVTLEPVENVVDEPVDLTFQLHRDTQPRRRGTDEEILLDPISAEEPPEPLQGGVVDLGAIATEFLILGINPYPRKQGVSFEAPSRDDPSDRPFAALAGLKKNHSAKGS